MSDKDVLIIAINPEDCGVVSGESIIFDVVVSAGSPKKKAVLAIRNMRQDYATICDDGQVNTIKTLPQDLSDQDQASFRSKVQFIKKASADIVNLPLKFVIENNNGKAISDVDTKTVTLG